jgi:hypothetical protein
MNTTLRFALVLAAAAVVTTPQASCYVDKTGAPANRPYLSSLSPSSVVAGSPGFTIAIKGYGFLPTDIVAWQGSPKTGTYVSSQEITAQIDASDIAQAGIAAVAIYRAVGSSTVYDQLWLVIKSPTP